MGTTPGSLELVGFGTVLESPQHGPQLVLGMLLESLPPQGGGPPITNWDWSAVSGYESIAGTTWGDYTVVGTYDGHALTLTRPPLSAGDHLDAMPASSPAGASAAGARLRETWRDPPSAGHAERTEAELLRVLGEVSRIPGTLMAGAGHDHVCLEVVHDDGALQRELDARYGAGVVRVSSALQPYRG